MKILKTRQRNRAMQLFLSLILFPATYYCFLPYLSFEGLAKGVLNGSMIILGLIFTGSLFFERLFCGKCADSCPKDFIHFGYGAGR